MSHTTVENDGKNLPKQNDSPREEADESGKNLPKPHVANNSGEQEWYTPREYVGMARKVMGEIDLDPASTIAANAIIEAKHFYTEEDDGLKREWSGRLWMNPPYKTALISQFCEHLADDYDKRAVEQAVVLVNNATETKWFQRLAHSATGLCLPLGRIRFWYPGRDSFTPLQGQAFFYFGQNHPVFREIFKSIGKVY